MGSNGLDLKKAGKGFYAAGNRERQAERSLGEGRMQSGTQALAANAAPWVQPIPPRGQGPDPCPRRPRSNRRPAAGGRPGRRWKSGRAASPPSPAVPPSAPLTIFLPAVSGPPLQDLSGPFKNGSAATSLPALAGARLSLPHLTTRLLRSARDGGRREARPKIQQNACASVPSAS